MKKDTVEIMDVNKLPLEFVTYDDKGLNKKAKKKAIEDWFKENPSRPMKGARYFNGEFDKKIKTGLAEKKKESADSEESGNDNT